MVTIAEQVALDVSKGLYSAAVGQQILANAGLTAPQIAAGVVGNPGAGAALGTNPMQRAGGASNWGTSVPATAIAAPGPVNAVPAAVPAAAVSSGPVEGQLTPDGQQIFLNGAWQLVAQPEGSGPGPEAEMVHAYYPPGSPRAGEYYGLMSAADAAFLNLVPGEAPGAATNGAATNGAPGATVSLDQSILDKVMAGTIIPTSDLAQIENATIREQAATQLAKLLVAGLGNTQAAIQEISPIYQQYIDLPGMEALNFNDWAVSAGLDWAQVPPPGETPAVNVDGGNVDDPMFLDDARAKEVEGFGSVLDESPGDPQMAGTEDTMSLEYINKFLSAFLDSYPNDPEAALQAAANWAVQNGTVFGGQAFTDVNDALALFRGATGPDPLGGDPTELQPGTVPLSEIFGYYGNPESQRTFGQIYPGFTSLLPGYGTSPAVASAYRAAQAPLEAQYLASQATTPFSPGGIDTPVSDVGSWLEGLQGGSQSLMMGQDYAKFLRDLSGVLQSGGATVEGLGHGVQGKMKGMFGDPAAQLAAFKNPFYRATAGSPSARQAIMNQIDQAAQRYMYQEPTGQFLPWAIEQNIGGIQGILPTLTPGAAGMLDAFGNR